MVLRTVGISQIWKLKTQLWSIMTTILKNFEQLWILINTILKNICKIMVYNYHNFGH